MCYFDYPCCSWYSVLSQKNKNKLQIMQNKIVLFILGMGLRTHIGQGELGMVRMISCQDRVMQLKLNHVFKIFHNISPQYLKFYFTTVSSVHKYSTRGSSCNFAVPKSKGRARFTFNSPAMIYHWNALPNEIKNTNAFNMFKQLVKKASGESWFSGFISSLFAACLVLVGILFFLVFCLCSLLPLPLP